MPDSLVLGGGRQPGSATGSDLRLVRVWSTIVRVNLAAAATTFGLVFAAELPDKTSLASLVLGSRYRPGYVYAGVAVAFAVHVLLAVVAGSLLALLPHRLLAIIVAVLFAVGAAVLIRGRHDASDLDSAEQDTRPATFWRVAATSFAVIFVAEFGDLTQILIVNLAARYHQPLVVGVSAALALLAVAGLAVAGGRGLLRLMPARLISLIGAAVMIVLAIINLISAITS